MFRARDANDVHPLIHEYIAAFGGEPVEVSVEGLARATTGRRGLLYLDHVENLHGAYDLTACQAILFVENGEYRLEHPFTGTFREPPGGTFHRFVLPNAGSKARYTIRTLSQIAEAA